VDVELLNANVLRIVDFARLNDLQMLKKVKHA